MAGQTLVTYGTVVKVEIGKDDDLKIEWELDGGMTALQSFNLRTSAGQAIIKDLCAAAGYLNVRATDDFRGRRCRIIVHAHSPCRGSNTFYFVVGFDR